MAAAAGSEDGLQLQRQGPAGSCRLECENCGAAAGLMRCSRCHAAWFCSLKCHKAYWPFHRAACRRNDFADAVEAQEPAFAAFLRGHGKLAVLQDEEVDRLECSSRPGGWRGLGRADVLNSMWGRADPAPAPPTYGAEASAVLAPAEAACAGGDGSGGIGSVLDGFEVPPGLGLAAGRIKWRQNLFYVEAVCALPAGASGKQVSVDLQPGSVCITAAGETLLSGALAAPVKVEGSTWFCVDGVVQLHLLKRNRKGRYSDGSTAASTFWFSLMASGALAGGTLPRPYPPSAYYSCLDEADGLPAAPTV